MKTKINGKKLLDKLTDLGWDYQCMTKSGRETYDEIMTMFGVLEEGEQWYDCLLYTSPSPRDRTRSRMPSSA